MIKKFVVKAPNGYVTGPEALDGSLQRTDNPMKAFRFESEEIAKRVSELWQIEGAVVEPYFPPKFDGCYDPTYCYMRSYTIPFRPEYLLIQGPDLDKRGLEGFVNGAAPTGRDLPGFRFHLSPEAVRLIAEQDPGVTATTGFHAIIIKFDACKSGVAVMEVERAILYREIADTTTEATK